MRRPAAVLATLFASVLLTSGCSGNQAEPREGDTRGFSQADVDFAIQLQAHHQQALAMAEMASGKAASPDVRRLAEKINLAQGREIDLMARWIQKWAEQGAKLPGHGEGGHGTHGPGMMSEADMQRLERTRGHRFDDLWLRSMIEHHRGALAMARDELQHGTDPAAQRLARDVLRTQQAEVARMRDMLAVS